MWFQLQFRVTVPKILRFESQNCLTALQYLRFGTHVSLKMLKLLRFETQVCLTMSKSSYVDLHFSVTVLKSLSCEIQVWFIVSKNLWRERITILSHKLVVFVIWTTILYHSAEKIENWSTFLSHNVKLFGMWIRVLYHGAKKNLRFELKVCLTVLKVLTNEIQLVSQCRNHCEVITIFVSQWWKLWEVNYRFV